MKRKLQSRRFFLGGSAVFASSALRTMGANERIRVGVIGNGHRGIYVMRGFMARPDCEIAAVCDVYKPHADEAAKIAGNNPAIYSDYRRILERTDIDAVLIAVPDHWHASMMIEACKGGKDVYIEKPLCLTIEGGRKMIEAAGEYRRVVQVGLQQRSIEHFKKCAEMIQNGTIGKIAHVSIVQPGHYGSARDEASAPPPDLDWEMFQGPAERRPYTKNRQSRWRGYWDYGGGLVTDWGVHWTDVAHWFLKDDQPRSASASAQYVAFNNAQMVQDVFSIGWTYDDFIVTFMNYDPPSTPKRFMSGITFFGERGSLLVNRMGYILTPKRIRTGDLFEPQDYLPPKELIPLNEEAKDHVVNFVECIRTRSKPITHVEIGFQSTLPNLLALISMRKGRTVRWNGRAAELT